MNRPIRERLLSKTVINWETGCWEWTAARDRDGYGQIGFNGQVRGAHRVAYTVLVAEVPSDLQLDHLCRNRACINPAHLEPVTVLVNTLRGSSFAAVNAAKTHCDKGHPFNNANTYYRETKKGPARACRACNSAAVARYKARKAQAASQEARKPGDSS